MVYKLAVKVVRFYKKTFTKGSRQGSASTFVVLNFGCQQCRTSTKFNEVNPLWNESFYFDLSGPFPQGYILEAFVYGVNKSIQSSASLLGKVRLHVNDKYTDDVRVRYYPLEKSGMFSREATGSLGLKVTFIGEHSIGAQESKFGASLQSAAMRLCVEIISAHGLKPKDEQGSSSTCVELSFDYYQYRTTVKEKDLNPVWNERFYFDVWDPSSLPTLVLEACVYNVNKSIKGYKSFLGEVRLNLYSFLSYSDAATTSYHLLQRSGMFSQGVTGGLRLRIYIAREPSIRAPRLIGFPELHVPNNLESILRNQRVQIQYLIKITNNFSGERILGQSCFGVVYKGVHKNGDMIAVKKIVSPFFPGLQKQFENEVYHLMMLKHTNIARYVGYCFTIQPVRSESNYGKQEFVEVAERFVCLDYLSNGSLDNYLSVADESREVDWSTRYNIIEGICYGLRHLHMNYYKPIIHMNLHPSNILLDEGMVPKITDFGPRQVDQQLTIKTSSRDQKHGYKPPEFFHGNGVTPMSNIFSLGVIILEVMTGRNPDITKEYRHGIRMEMLETWRNVVQRSLRHGCQGIDWERIKRCIRVGLICMNPNPTKRPQIATVINMLQGLERTYCDITNLPTMDCSLCSREFDVPNNLERTLQYQVSKPEVMTFQHLEEITNNFSDERIVGEGSSGVVYKGVLQNGEIIAVKKIVSPHRPGLQKKYESEVCHLMALNHSNIVRCVGYCNAVQKELVPYKGQQVFGEVIQTLICLEYLPKGNLLKYLPDKSAILDWSIHYNIIQGICYGLRHLHDEIDKPIIHRDLKPENILLDDHMVPKITDFGISRHVQSHTVCTSSRDGTFGYMSPEFLHGGIVTSKSDIFSLGVIIIEITARNREYPDVTTTSPDEFIQIALDKWRNVIKREQGSQELNFKQIERCIRVGLICVIPDRTKRPPITKVINMLQGVESIDYVFVTQQPDQQARYDHPTVVCVELMRALSFSFSDEETPSHIFKVAN